MARLTPEREAWIRNALNSPVRPSTMELYRTYLREVLEELDAVIARRLARTDEKLARWGRRNAQRVTRSDNDIEAMRGASARKGILPFLVDGSEVPEELTVKYRGPVRQVHLQTEQDGHD